jgi:hypothetical protein
VGMVVVMGEVVVAVVVVAMAVAVAVAEVVVVAVRRPTTSCRKLSCSNAVRSTGVAIVRPRAPTIDALPTFSMSALTVRQVCPMVKRRRVCYRPLRLRGATPTAE